MIPVTTDFRVLTPLEQQAAAIAERAQNWIHSQCPHLPAWEDVHPAHQAGAINSAMTVLAITTVINDPTAGADA